MKKLSKREKIMVYVMMLFLIAGGGFLLIRQFNLVGKYQKASSAYSDKQMEMEVAGISATGNSTIDTDLKDKREEVSNLLKKCKSVVTNDYVEQDLVAFAKKNGLSVKSTSFQEQDTTDAASGQAIDMENGGVSLTNETKGATASQPVASDSLKKKTVNVTMQLAGPFSGFCNYIQGIRGQAWARITNFRCYDKEDLIRYNINNHAEYTYYVEVEYNMMQPVK
jgi:hypothetical protein